MSSKYPTYRRWSLKLVPCLAAALLAATSGSSQIANNAALKNDNARKEKKFSDEQIVVKFKPEVTPDRITALNRQFGGKFRKKFKRLPGVQVITVPKGTDITALCKQYVDSGTVVYAEPDYLLQTFQTVTVNDPRYTNGSQWPLLNVGQNNGTADCDIDADEAWFNQGNATNVVVAVIDTGLRLTHEDIVGNLWTNPGEIADNSIDDDLNGITDDVHGINTVPTTPTGDPTDADTGTYHGTHVSGIIGAVGNNSLGIAGVTLDVQIMALKAADLGSSIPLTNVVECIGYAVDNGADIINASIGFTGLVQAGVDFLEDAVEDARNAGVILVAAAGNSNSNNDANPVYPANTDLNNVVSVMATDRRDRVAGILSTNYDLLYYPGGAVARYSNYGQTSVDLAAPGGAILVTLDGSGNVTSQTHEVMSLDGASNNGYRVLSGTSQAAPHVAGALALVRARFPAEDYLHAIDRILISVDRPVTLDNLCATEGRLNINRALRNFNITAVTPSPVARGSQITITGTFYNNSSPVVKIGGVTATSVTQISETEIRATVPATTPVGSNSVEVTLAGVRSPGFVLQAPAQIQVYPPYTFSWAYIDEQGDIDDFTAVATIAPGGLSAYLEVSYQCSYGSAMLVDAYFTIDYVSGPDYVQHDYYNTSDEVFFSVAMSRATHVSASGSIWVDFDTGTAVAEVH